MRKGWPAPASLSVRARALGATEPREEGSLPNFARRGRGGTVGEEEDKQGPLWAPWPRVFPDPDAGGRTARNKLLFIC